MSSWTKAAYLSKARQLQGGLVARNAAGLPFLLRPGLEVSFVPPTLDGDRHGVVESVERLSGEDYLVFFRNIRDIDAAQRLAGSFCLARTEDVGEALAQTPGLRLEGCRVVDIALGEVGVVSGIVDNLSQQLLEVTSSDGSVFLVPNVDAIVVSFDVDARIVRTSLPAGIMDL